MTESSMEKWPAEIKIVKITNSLLGEEFNQYLISGVMNQEQKETIKSRLPILSEFVIDSGKVVITSLVMHVQLGSAYDKFIPLAKEFRGQYYVIAKKFVEVAKEVLY